VVTVPDLEDDIVAELTRLVTAYDVVITSGGVGRTSPAPLLDSLGLPPPYDTYQIVIPLTDLSLCTFYVQDRPTTT